MKALLVLMLWLLLFAVCWPLAILAILLAPLVWLVSIPLRLVLWVVMAALLLVKSILFLPARLLGFRAAI